MDIAYPAKSPNSGESAMAKQRVCVILFFALIHGCEPSALKTVPVTGIVTLNGRPVANIGVSFLPVRNDKTLSGSSGFTDEQGRYELRVNKTTERGALVGKHRIVIIRGTPHLMTDAPGHPTFQEVPEWYNTKSRLFFDVPSTGTAAANFDLKIP